MRRSSRGSCAGKGFRGREHRDAWRGGGGDGLGEGDGHLAAHVHRGLHRLDDARGCRRLVVDLGGGRRLEIEARRGDSREESCCEPRVGDGVLGGDGIVRGTIGSFAIRSATLARRGASRRRARRSRLGWQAMRTMLVEREANDFRPELLWVLTRAAPNLSKFCNSRHVHQTCRRFDTKHAETLRAKSNGSKTRGSHAQAAFALVELVTATATARVTGLSELGRRIYSRPSVRPRLAWLYSTTSTPTHLS